MPPAGFGPTVRFVVNLLRQITTIATGGLETVRAATMFAAVFSFYFFFLSFYDNCNTRLMNRFALLKNKSGVNYTRNLSFERGLFYMSNWFGYFRVFMFVLHLI